VVQEVTTNISKLNIHYIIENIVPWNSERDLAKGQVIIFL